MFKLASKKTQTLSRAFSTSSCNPGDQSCGAKTKKVPTVMCVNRGEIATRVYRAAHELGFKSLGVYSDVDANSLHRFKAQKSVPLNSKKSAVGQYLDIDGLIEIAKKNKVDIIHPGYGFLAENAEFATKIEKAGMLYAGPPGDVVDFFGDKVRSKQFAIKHNINTIPGTDGPVRTLEDARKFTDKHNFPVIVKAAAGGGGRGMRVARNDLELEEAYTRAKSEALASFGDDTVFIERYLEEPRHIEVQILADSHGNVIHLFERDCSVQRRHQKVVEIAPAVNLPDKVREAVTRDAVALAKFAKYRSAGTVEFLVDKQGRHYFMECNTRIQVEHTVTEEVTGVDLLQAMLRIALGESLPEMGLTQDKIKMTGAAIQCRVTTEDPLKAFQPDTGKIQQYSPGGGMGIRVDGNAFNGAVITPSYDSLLCKITGSANTFEMTCKKLIREIKETKIRGVKTNQQFLLKVLQHPTFLSGNVTTHFIDQNPDLFDFKYDVDEGSKVLKWFANFVVNPTPQLAGAGCLTQVASPRPPRMPDPEPPIPRGWRNVFLEKGPKAFAKAVNEHKPILFMDTTWRDAHQSLLMTRMRTRDLKGAAYVTRHTHHNFYSIEMWGGATFDVALRFLHECPWDRITELRELVPNIPFQMLLRGTNAVGYTAYPDNVIYEFCKESVKYGIDVFRVFDSLNYFENIKLGMDAVGTAGGIIEAAICYTGLRKKYPLEYYVDYARKLIEYGTHVLCIKDMTGLLKPYDAKLLISTLKKEFPNTPINVHTHDNAGAGVATHIAATEAGASVINVATDNMSGVTSQPSLGTLAHCLKGQPRDPKYLIDDEDYGLNQYWGDVRELYLPFEGPQRSSFSETYEHEMPGGQYTNLQFQAKQLGLGSDWGKIKRTYQQANEVLGDIIKVTPSSKVVGDLAQFMTANNLDDVKLMEQSPNLQVPKSVLEYLQGYLGQPHGGFPEPLRTNLLKAAGLQPIHGRPGDSIAPLDFAKLTKELEERHGKELDIRPVDVISAALYPEVFEDFCKFRKEYGNLTTVPTEYLLRPIKFNEKVSLKLKDNTEMDIQLIAIGEVDKKKGTRVVCFDVNGWFRTVEVADKSIKVETKKKEKANPSNPGSIGSPMTGSVVEVKFKVGQEVKKNDVVAVLTAMKMELVVKSSVNGKVKRVLMEKGSDLEAGDLILELEVRG
jgi:pyruvate carboxylase